MRALDIEVEKNSDRTVVTVAGEIDVASADVFRDKLCAEIANGSSTVIADLAGVSFMDSTGLRALATAHRDAVTANCEFAVQRCSEPVTRLLELTRMSDHIRVIDPPPAELD